MQRDLYNWNRRQILYLRFRWIESANVQDSYFGSQRSFWAGKLWYTFICNKQIASYTWNCKSNERKPRLNTTEKNAPLHTWVITSSADAALRPVLLTDSFRLSFEDCMNSTAKISVLVFIYMTMFMWLRYTDSLLRYFIFIEAHA